MPTVGSGTRLYHSAALKSDWSEVISLSILAAVTVAPAANHRFLLMCTFCYVIIFTVLAITTKSSGQIILCFPVFQ